MRIYHIQKSRLKRILNGHPWVFSNEIIESLREVELGELIELREPHGGFLARGIAHPHSLIAVRIVTRDSAETDSLSEECILKKLQRSYALREKFSLTNNSFRWLFAEVDAFPGLILDSYLLADGKSRVLVFQPQSVSAEVLLKQALKVIPQLVNCAEYAVLVKRNSSSRILDGLELKETEVFFNNLKINLKACEIVVRFNDQICVNYKVNLIDGQKTGFFLDQRSNVDVFLKFFLSIFGRLAKKRQGKLRVCDLFSYVAQWSAALVKLCHMHQIPLELTLVDASEEALNFAESNVRSTGIDSSLIKIEKIKTDIFQWIGSNASESFNLVLCDPPALIKGRKNIKNGELAYTQLNAKALKMLSRGGLFVSSSCSQLLSHERFFECLADAERKAHASLVFFYEGRQASDHPTQSVFREGFYLKCFMALKKEL